METITPSFEDTENESVDLDIDNIPLTADNLVSDSNNLEELSASLTDDELKKEIAKLRVEQINSLEIYKIIVETRKFEIDNFWKRTLFFWGTLAIVIAGYFNAKNSEHYLLFIAYIGFFYNLIFSLSLRGSKYWQEHWEYTASNYEKKLNFRLFRWDLFDKINSDNKDVFFLFRPYRFSVSKLSMILSDITILLWIILIIKDIKFLKGENALHFNFGFYSSIDWFTCGTIIIPLLSLSYIAIFFRKSVKKHN